MSCTCGQQALPALACCRVTGAAGLDLPLRFVANFNLCLQKLCKPGPFFGAGSLLDHIGGYVNPLRLITRIPEGMAIARLRDRIVQIVADFRTQTSLREGCNTILHTDCVLLAQVGDEGIAKGNLGYFHLSACPPALGAAAALSLVT